LLDRSAQARFVNAVKPFTLSAEWMNPGVLMDLREFRQSLAADAPPAGLDKLAQALWFDAKDDWRRAHEIAQSVQGKAGARVHAYLHRKEGDRDNANYWYDRAGAVMPKVPLKKEWELLATRLLRAGGTQSRCTSAPDGNDTHGDT
jgi:hypothetical protein